MIEQISREKFFEFRDYDIFKSILLELTYNCNHKCPHCYQDNNNKTEIEFSLFKDIVDQLEHLGVFEITLTGGEIFLHTKIWDILQYLTEKQIAIFLLTNGSLLDKEKIKKLKRYNIFQVDITIHSLNSKIHDDITGIPGSLKRTLKNIAILKKEGLNVRIKTLIFNKNQDSIIELMDYTKANGLILNIDFILAPGKNKDTAEYRLDFNKLDKKLVSFFKSQMEEKKIKNKGTCRPGKKGIVIDPAGIVYPCGYLRFPLGDLKKNKLIEILNSIPIKEVQEYKKNKKFQCPNCEIYDVCHRRCIGINYMENGNIFKNSEYICNLMKFIWKNG